MTDGHQHIVVQLSADVRWQKRLLRFLTKPRYWTNDRRKADLSPYPYGVDRDCYYLSILSVLHRWTGLTLKVE